MATITATPTSAPRTRHGVRDRVRAAAARAARQAAQAVSTARHRNLRSPVLTAFALASGVEGVWTLLGRGAMFITLCAAVFFYDWLLG